MSEARPTRSIWSGLQQPARRGPGRPPKDRQAGPRELTFPRAAPAELAAFDPASRRCTMNCGPHRDDPRSHAERMLLCGDCLRLDPEAERR